MINMKDFTLYPEALELKELGFDEPCFAWYHLGDTLLSDITMGYEKTDFLYTQDDMEETQCTAPTYSQAFRWFRDNGKVAEIFSQLLPSNKYKWGFKIQGIEGVTDGFFTYEEAELACLREMIKLIKK
jgi:hypothetical protein